MRRISTLVICLWCLCLSVASADRLVNYRKTVKFYAFSYSYPKGVVSSLNDTLEAFDCEDAGNTTFIVHGWLESVNRRWVRPLVKEYLNLRGNCVFVMDYSYFSVRGYFKLTPHFYNLADLLVEKILAVAAPERLQLFGFSFGARQVLHAGIKLNRQGFNVSQIFACDPAGPGFGNYGGINRNAAKQVQCIHTSNNYGTSRYDCQQNWRLGKCGNSQPGHRPFPYGSHGLCPYLFTASFNVDFMQDNFYNCSSKRAARNLPADLFMGPRETRIDYEGEIFAPTAKNPPWNVIDGVIDNEFVDFPGPDEEESSEGKIDETKVDAHSIEDMYNEIKFSEASLYD